MTGRQFPCGRCHKQFAKKRQMMVHYQDAHSFRQTFPCELCGRRFFSEENLKRHTELVEFSSQDATKTYHRSTFHIDATNGAKAASPFQRSRCSVAACSVDPDLVKQELIEEDDADSPTELQSDQEDPLAVVWVKEESTADLEGVDEICDEPDLVSARFEDCEENVEVKMEQTSDGQTTHKGSLEGESSVSGSEAHSTTVEKPSVMSIESLHDTFVCPFCASEFSSMTVLEQHCEMHRSKKALLPKSGQKERKRVSKVPSRKISEAEAAVMYVKTELHCVEETADNPAMPATMWSTDLSLADEATTSKALYEDVEMDAEEMLDLALASLFGDSTERSSPTAAETGNDADNDCGLFQAGISSSSGSESSADESAEQSDNGNEAEPNQTPGRRFRKYDNCKLLDAIAAVKNGMSKRGAAEFYHIPRTTLRDYLSGKYRTTKMGGTSTLSPEEEKRVAEFIVKCCKKGLGRTTIEARDLVETYVKSVDKASRFKNGRPSRHWMRRFMLRHHISSRKGKGHRGGRALVTEAQIRNWFKEIGEIFEEDYGGTGVFADTSRVFNCDETAVFLEPANRRVLCETGQKSVKVIQQAGEKDNVSCLMTIRANGDVLPPFMCFKDTKPARQWQNTEPQAYWYGFTKKGWMTGDSFQEYLKKLKQWLDSKGAVLPVVLILDGHSSHDNASAVMWALDNGIIIVRLFPNSAHIYQPLDTHIFSGFKGYYAEELLAWQRNNPESRVCADNVGNIVLRAMRRLKTTSVTNSFLHNGLVPLNPDAVNYTHCDKQNDGQTPTSIISANATTAESGPEVQHDLVPADESFARKVLCFISMFYAGRANGLQEFERDMSAHVTADSEVGVFSRRVVASIRHFYKDDSCGLNQFELDMKAVLASLQPCLCHSQSPSIPCPTSTTTAKTSLPATAPTGKTKNQTVNRIRVSVPIDRITKQPIAISLPMPASVSTARPAVVDNHPVDTDRVPIPYNPVTKQVIQQRITTLTVLASLPATMTMTTVSATTCPSTDTFEPASSGTSTPKQAANRTPGQADSSAITGTISVSGTSPANMTPGQADSSASSISGNGPSQLNAEQKGVSLVLLNLTATPKTATRTKEPTLRLSGAAVPGSKRFKVSLDQHLVAKQQVLEDRKQAKRKRKYCCGKNLQGGMVGCDGEDCGEWFHFRCAGITAAQADTERWFCPNCKV